MWLAPPKGEITSSIEVLRSPLGLSTFKRISSAWLSFTERERCAGRSVLTLAALPLLTNLQRKRKESYA